MDIRHVHVDLDSGLFSVGITVMDGREPTSHPYLLSYLSDRVFILTYAIGQVFGLFSIDSSAALSGVLVALRALGIFMDEAREPSVGDTEAMGDRCLGF